MRTCLPLLGLLGACGDDPVNRLPDGPPGSDASPDAIACESASFESVVDETRAVIIAGDGTLYFTQGTTVGRILPCSQTIELAWVDVGQPDLRSLMLDPPNHRLFVASASADAVFAIDLAAATPTATSYVTLDEPRYMTLGPDGALWISSFDSLYRARTADTLEVATTTALSSPKGIAFRADGALVVAQYSDAPVALTLDNGRETARVTLGTGELISGAEGLALDAAGDLYISNGDGDGIAHLDATGAGIEILGRSIGGQLEFGAGVRSSKRLYRSGPNSQERDVAVVGAVVPWHAVP